MSHWIIRKIRSRIYKMGYRPKPGVFYSPSLDMTYGFRDRVEALEKQCEERRRSNDTP